MLTRLSIANFRGYRDRQVFDFVGPDENRPGLNILVGQNNSGKSTALSVVKELFAQSQDFIFDSMSRTADLEPEITLSGQFDQGVETIQCVSRTRDFYVKIVNELDVAQSENRRNALRSKIKFVPSRRAWSDRFNRQGRQKRQQLEEQLYNTQRNQEAQLGLLLADILREGRKQDFDAILKQVMPEIADWSIDHLLGQDFISYQNATGQRHSLSMLGDGYSSVFRMAYTLHSSEPGDVIILDEPELSLHPEAQKSLYKLLVELSRTRQIILATHSPYMVNWKELANGASLFRLAQGNDGFVRANSLSADAIRSVLPAVTTDIRNRKLFDVLAKEVFFRKRVMFCEGQEDVHFIENYIEEAGKQSLPLFGYGSGGASWIDKWLTLATDLNIRSAALFDMNEQVEAERVTNKYRNNDDVRVWVLPADDIRNKPEKEVTGIFETNGIIRDEFSDQFEGLIDEINVWLTD